MPIHTRQLEIVVLECEQCGRKHQIAPNENATTPPRGWTNQAGVIRCPRDSRRAGVA